VSGWYICNLGDAMLAGESLNHICALFQSEYDKAGQPNDMAIFVRHESEGRLHCEVKVYFSPAAAYVTETVDATPCNKPVADGLDLLAGSQDSWPLLFSGKAMGS